MELNTATIDSIPSIENILKVDELSEDEFKTKIIKWFKDRGLLSEMRTYMRCQMITYLKDTQIGNALAEKTTQQPILPKERTIHFLVAEYLLHNQYYYSLSILVSEVTFLNVFPDMSAIKKSNTSLTKSQELFRFDKNDIMEFIQSLGIFKNSLEAEQICKFYLKNSNYSLLTIILRVLIERTVITSDSSSKSLDLETTDKNETICSKWNNAVFALLKKALLKNSNIYFIRDNIVKFFMNEFDKFQNDMETKQKIEFDKMKDAIENEFECKEMHLKENLLEMEQKFNKEMSFYINTLTSKDEVIGKLRCELKKFENFNDNIQKLKQKYSKEEENKKRYKETAQLLKHECLKLQEQLMTSKEQTSKKDSELLSLKETIRKMQEDFDNKLKIYDIEISDLKLTNIKLKNELDQEKTGAILTQVKHQEEISRNNSLLAEITELKTKNQTLENYLNELNKRSDELNRQFQNTMKSIQTIDKHKRFENEILHSKKSNIKLNEKTFLSDSESASPAASIIDILNETKQRLDNLQVETQVVEENYDKHCIQTSLRYADLWRTTQIVANQNVSTSTHTTDKGETLNEHALTDYERVKNDSTHNVKVGTEDELQQIPEPPQFGASKLPPLFEELHTNILSSFQNFQSTVLEVSRDLNTFVQSTSKLSDNLIKPKSDTLQQEHKINLKAKELESSFLQFNDIENDIMDDFISKIDPLTDRGWYRLDNEKTVSVPTFKTANSKIDAPLINNDWFFRLENEKTSHVSSSVQTFDSINVSKSIQTLDNVDFVKSDDQLQNKPYQNEEEFKLDIYETNSMEFIYEQNMEDNQSGHYSGNGIQSQLEIIQEIENMENNNTKTIETENISEVKEVGSEYVIEPLKTFSLPLQCDAGNIEDQTKNYSPSNHSTKPICSRHPDIDQATSSKNYNNSEYSRMNEPTSSKHDSDSIISQIKDQEETNNTASHSLQNIIESLVNKVYSSTEDIVAIIDDKDKKQQEKEQLVHILEQISIEDIPNNKSSNSNTNSLNSPISTGFDNKNDDFWM